MAKITSGIPVSEDVRTAFFDLNQSGNGRFIIAKISGEQEIKLDKVVKGTDDWRKDLDLIPSELGASIPSYILFRTDNTTPHGYGWLFFTYVPDSAKIREKMTYSSTRSTLKKECGGVFEAEIFGSAAREFSRAGYEEWEASQAAPAPLTEAEEIKQSFEYTSVLDHGSTSGGAMVHGVPLTAHSEASEAVKKLTQGGVNYVRLGIDLDKEIIVLQETDSISLNDLSKKIPLDTAAFHFFRYDHEFMGEKQSPVIYVYSCPDGSGSTRSASVKMRMMYSSSKGAAADLTKAYGVNVALKLEVNEPNDIDSDTILTKLHPVVVEKKAGFSKPKAAGRGTRRLLK